MRHPLAAFALLLLPSAALAQSTPMSLSPADVAVNLFQALQTSNWTLVASLIHPEALAAFRDQLLTSADAWEQLKARRPVSARDGNHVLGGFPGIATLNELKTLTAQDLFARYLASEAPDPSAYDDGRPPVWTRTVIGFVRESDSLAHVVYRTHVDVGRFGETEETEVVTAQRFGSGWRLRLNRDLSFQGSVRIVRGRASPGDN